MRIWALVCLWALGVAAFDVDADEGASRFSDLQEQSLSLREALTSIEARATAAKRRSKAEIKRMRKSCRENFHRVDTDSDRRLSLEEFQHLLQIMGEKHGF
mmetsp:Transcript_69521/g.165804  ORF Transcript_69521/g.165804 Transcript_69521/m.165804 type:complete len:101 (-) Transcript_69521:51-353(-)|eukprot:CAMPEP_0181462708 /NCGR_PEP_ID=MMETSP1110-20121109/34535_1 /TAXON_ID=174948 /ORGANISM="Symbiodinium sp., Strain CCMP421" /LENGTH=100 /DNA_ID=CAMNT_0023587377 /DNA_START=41 /DNA_END=343 /DNA_ORIENTATION=-